MLTQAEIDAMRDHTELAMPDTVSITRPAARTGGSLNPSTGLFTPAAATTVYTGKGRVRPITVYPTEVVFGDEHVAKQRYVGTFPWDAGTLQIDDRVAVTVSSDSTISGRTFRVMAVAGGSFLIDRRVQMEAVE